MGTGSLWHLRKWDECEVGTCASDVIYALENKPHLNAEVVAHDVCRDATRRDIARFRRRNSSSLALSIYAIIHVYHFDMSTYMYWNMQKILADLHLSN
jgi:hypothetical protein